MATTLLINRMIVFANQKVVFDEKFHTGVNIIRGDNSVGKSSVMDLLYFGLGGDTNKWNEHQSLCTHVILEIECDEKVFSIKREISNSLRVPMYISDLTIDSALGNSQSWYKFPFRRSDSTQSFSQFLFDILNLPQSKTDESRNLTMHQLLRLIYVDQMDNVDKLLKDDSFDSSITRKAIGEYLLGIDDLEAHNLRQDLILKNKEIAEIAGELKAIRKILSQSIIDYNKININKELDKLQKKLITHDDELKTIRETKLNKLNTKSINILKDIELELSTLTNKKITNDDKISMLNLEIKDIHQFIPALKDKLNSLSNSLVTEEILGTISFKYCPACLQPLDEHKDSDNCILCNQTLENQSRRFSYIEISNEIKFQISESQQLANRYQDDILLLKNDNLKIESNISILRQRYQDIMSLADTYDAIISDISSEIGLIKGRIENLTEKLSLDEQVRLLSIDKEKVQLDANAIFDKITKLEEKTQHRLSSVYDNIEKIALSLIKADGNYEETFKNAEQVSFDFYKDYMSVNGKSKFSASSTVIMKNCIRLAIFLFSMQDKQTRFPSIFILDNTEDKGMTFERSQGFQRTLVEACETIKSSYQVIISTSMIDPELDKSKLVVGRYYSKGDHTLEL